MSQRTLAPVAFYKTFPEVGKALEPVPYVTARRFWLLVYLLLGFNGIAMLLSRFVLRPLYIKLLGARASYQAQVRNSLEDFISLLASRVTALPGRNIIVDMARHRLLVNTETQTDDDFGRDVSPSNAAQSVSSDHLKLTSILHKIPQAGMTVEEESYRELSSKMVELKLYLQDFASYEYKSLQSGFSSNNSPAGTSDAVQKVKAEIRSVKGTLLNARSFHAIPSAKSSPHTIA